MGKRSRFARRPKDFYPTPPAAVVPLLPFLPDGFTYCEPCAGDGSLVEALGDLACRWVSDIEPRAAGMIRMDALDLSVSDVADSDYIITNPPWSRHLLHPMIDHFSSLRPTWLLFDADWMHTKQSSPYMKLCSTVVSIGRVKWIPNSPFTGKDNCAWYHFPRRGPGIVPPYGTLFYGR